MDDELAELRKALTIEQERVAALGELLRTHERKLARAWWVALGAAALPIVLLAVARWLPVRVGTLAAARIVYVDDSGHDHHVAGEHDPTDR